MFLILSSDLIDRNDEHFLPLRNGERFPEGGWGRFAPMMPTRAL